MPALAILNLLFVYLSAYSFLLLLCLLLLFLLALWKRSIPDLFQEISHLFLCNCFLCKCLGFPGLQTEILFISLNLTSLHMAAAPQLVPVVWLSSQLAHAESLLYLAIPTCCGHHMPHRILMKSWWKRQALSFQSQPKRYRVRTDKTDSQELAILSLDHFSL